MYLKKRLLHLRDYNEVEGYKAARAPAGETFEAEQPKLSAGLCADFVTFEHQPDFGGVQISGLIAQINCTLSLSLLEKVTEINLGKWEYQTR